MLGGRRVGIHRSMSLAARARRSTSRTAWSAVIGAGSAPFAQPLGQIAGALLAGNGVVFKPARRAGLAGERIARAARARGPAGGPRGGRARRRAGRGRRWRRRRVDKVLFTGSPAVGRAVARACVSREREVTVELGGKDAMLVLADAHLSRAADGALWAGCAGAGQARGAIERVYVAREVVEPFARGSGRAARGDCASATRRDPGTQVGPLASPRRLEHVRELVDGRASRRALGCTAAARSQRRGVARARSTRPRW